MTEMSSNELPHVLDLPQISTRPSFESLIDTLALLEQKPPSWGQELEQKQTCPEDSQAVAAYLTQIVSSSLKWLEDDEEREKIYDMASKRLSERTGRSGMSAMTRTWKIPATSSSPEIVLDIHEPPLTEDNIGLKTWASSYLLARRLEIIGHTHLNWFLQKPGDLSGLELGAGTGLVGLAAAAIWGCSMHLTDLPAIVPNLSLNVDSNIETIHARGAQVTTAVHDWNDPPSTSSRYQVILAADPLYSPDHANLLSYNISQFLDNDPKARAIIELPMRDKSTEAMCQDLRHLMSKRGFELLEEGLESGFDDWEENGARAEVSCWWGVFRRKIGGARDD